jgi:hypothetical protein
MPGRASSKVPTTTAGTTTDAVDPAPPKTTTQGDWQLEEVPTNGKAISGGQPAKENATNPGSTPNKLTEGDWSIEELKSKQTSVPEK